MAGDVNRRLGLNPTMEQMKHSRLNLTVAGTKETVLMIEGAADFLPESLMVEAVEFAHEATKTQCAGLEKLARVAGKEKLYDNIKSTLEGMQGAVYGRYANRVNGIYGGGLVKEEQSAATSMTSKLVGEEMEEAYTGEK